MTTYKENRIRLDPKVHESLRYYIAEQREALKDVKGAVIDENTVVSNVTREFLELKGHYPPKTGGTLPQVPQSTGTEYKDGDSHE